MTEHIHFGANAMAPVPVTPDAQIVTAVRHWTDSLFSFRVTRPRAGRPHTAARHIDSATIDFAHCGEAEDRATRQRAELEYVARIATRSKRSDAREFD